MSQHTKTAPTPSDSNRPGRSGVVVRIVPFTLVLLSAILVVIPWSRPVGIVFLLLLFIPSVVVWVRARKLTDGSRGLTTATMIIGCIAFFVGTLSSESAPSTPPADAVPAPTVERAVAPPAPAPVVVAPPAPQVVPAPLQVVPAPQPRVGPPPPAVTPAPRIAPAPRVAPALEPPPAAKSDGSVYYKNCDAARAAGAAPLYTGEPGYRTALDRDKDGIACE